VKVRSICEKYRKYEGNNGRKKKKKLRETNKNLKIVDINIDNLLKDMYT